MSYRTRSYEIEIQKRVEDKSDKRLKSYVRTSERNRKKSWKYGFTGIGGANAAHSGYAAGRGAGWSRGKSAALGAATGATGVAAIEGVRRYTLKRGERAKNELERRSQSEGVKKYDARMQAMHELRRIANSASDSSKVVTPFRSRSKLGSKTSSFKQNPRHYKPRRPTRAA